MTDLERDMDRAVDRARAAADDDHTAAPDCPECGGELVQTAAWNETWACEECRLFVTVESTGALVVPMEDVR